MNIEKYTIGFNSGYLITKYCPDLARIICNPTTSPSEYLQGLLDGKGQYEFELSKNPLTQLQHLREKMSERNNNLERE